jgi:hypothetical protein
LKKGSLIIVFFFLFIKLQGQAQFVFIDSLADISKIKFLQTVDFKCSNKQDITYAFKEIKKHALNVGANSFKLNNYSIDSLGFASLSLDLYISNNKFLEENFRLQEKNSVYIVGNINIDNKLYTYKLNNKKKTINSGEYFKYIIDKGGKLKINKGGFFGTTVTTYWNANKEARFYSLSGFGLSDFNPIMGVAFTNGKIISLDKDFGFLLINILKRRN